jgi:hypothetical protein
MRRAWWDFQNKPGAGSMTEEHYTAAGKLTEDVATQHWIWAREADE